MALQGYKVVYEDENQQVIPHWDEAKNTAFDNTDTDLVSQDVQSAVKELNAKIKNNSSVSGSCNVKLLVDQPGYKEEYALDSIPTFNYRNKNNVAYTQNTFYDDTQNAAVLELADATTAFIQDVINNLKESEVLVFPENKIFLISYSRTGYQYGQEDLAYTIEEYNAASYTVQHSTQFYGLTIRTPVHINLAGSTLKAIPSFFHIYTLIDIKQRLWGYSDSTDPDNPSGTSIVNGTLLGFKAEGSNFGISYYTVENSMGIHAAVKVLLEDLEVYNFYGDCISISSKDDYSNNDKITFSQNKYLNPDNGKALVTNSNNLWVSGFYRVIDFKYHYYRYKLIFRPSFDNEAVHSYVDNANVFVNEKCTVSYYTSSNENSFIRSEVIHFGDMLNVPSNASHFRFGIDVDSSLYKASGNLDIKLMCVTISPDYGTIVRGCTLHDTTRDGITASSVYNGLIQNCRIYNCDQADIDIESLAYADKALTIDGLQANSVSSTTPYHIIIKNSTIGHFKTDCPNYIFDNCDIGTLVIYGPSYKYGYNVSFPRRVVKNTVIRNSANAADTIFENCIISGVMDRIAYTTAYSADHPNIFNNCVFKTNSILPGIYNNCKFAPRKVIFDDNAQAYAINRDLELQVYGTSDTYTQIESNKYKFDNCEFDVSSIYSSNTQFGANKRVGSLLYIDNCVFTISYAKGNQGEIDQNMDGRCSNFTHCYIATLINSKLIVNTNVPKYNNNGIATSFILSINLYGNTKINNNVIVASESATYSNFIRISLNNIVSNESYFVSIRDNIVHYYCTNASQDRQPTFVFVQPKSENDDIFIELENNAFKVIGEFTDVAELPAVGANNTIYHNTIDNKYYMWVAQSMYGTSGVGQTGVVYYNSQDRKFYIWNGEGFILASNENGYREVGKITDITFDYNAPSNYIDYVGVDAQHVLATVKNSKAVNGSINQIVDSRITRL